MLQLPGSFALRPEPCLLRTALFLRRRRLLVVTASAAASGAKWRSADAFRLYILYPQCLGVMLDTSAGFSGPLRCAPVWATSRNTDGHQAAKMEVNCLDMPRKADARDLPKQLAPKVTGSSRMSEQERVARKAARLADRSSTAARNREGCCYGCGAILQTEVSRGAGYVAPEKYAVRKQRRQLDKVLCQRCSDLCNGAMIPAVQDFPQKLQLRQLVGGATTFEGIESGDGILGREGLRDQSVKVVGPSAGGTSSNAVGADASTANLLGKVLVSPEQLRGQLKTLALRAALVVLLVDLTDVAGSLLTRVRDMVGRNPIVLVGTKMDLLPEGCRPSDVAEWLSGAAATKKLNVVSVHLVSSHTRDGMSAAVAVICSERKSRDVYVVGAANVGKSAFVRAMLKEMARTDPAALGMGKYLPVESAMPGTTLGLIPLRAFSSGGVLFDTPGIHLHHRVLHMLSPAELKLLHPRRRLSAYVPPLPVELTEGDSDDVGANEVVATNPPVRGPPSTALVFYGPTTLRVVGLPYIPPDKQLQVDYSDGSSSTNVLVCTDSVALRGGLQPKDVVVRANGAAGVAALADVVISGLPGWVSVCAPKAKQDVRLRIWAPRGVEVMLRPAMPCRPLRALEGAGRGERGRGSAEASEEPAALYEWSRALADGVSDPTSSPAWWEAMAALKDEDLPGYSVAAAAESSRSGRLPRTGTRGQTLRPRAVAGISADADSADGDDDLPDWDDEAEVLDDDGDDGSDVGGDDEEGVLITARVEDILKRPRLDILSQLDLELVPDEAEEVEDDIGSFTMMKSLGGRRRRDGPAADGMWDPLGNVPSVTSAVVSPAVQLQRSAGVMPRRKLATTQLGRRTAVSRSSDVATAGRERDAAPEAPWAEAEAEPDEAPSEGQGSTPRGTRLRLGRRRKIVRVAVSVDGAESEVS
ncbi:hypothetical protein VOLCADRAFT_120437 [Volvox carteri f. nagariensis]|uniref:Uncharacterized protein n=1 Tax=Volvox carteri f. nagariensis TaxID=3068 RepID=D8TLA7_VOLCA|nr:uncharacterized protein VOLCADRAFT_120437 [Volvox carteri f. nagariensis]EFJ51703.1 hypothetical protein VOLCADRAFT_120437 [Volvox carteri f. nagariensis]|eukprot:XP_002947113.1 hypothetical protein VOLCADRAFT_120437 [Volvox carteri f. nagariensis]